MNKVLTLRGIVSDVDKAGRVDRNRSLTLTFDRMRVRGQEHEIRALPAGSIVRIRMDSPVRVA